MDGKKSRLEAALFLADEPLDRQTIADILDLGSMGYISTLVEEFQDELEKDHRGLELVETPEGYELKVKKQHLNAVSHLAPHQDLNEGQLRTLSLIAYNSPVEQKDIIEVRGNRAYQHVKELVNRGFVSKEKDGRTAILDVTDHFLDYFEIDSVNEFKQSLESDVESAMGKQQQDIGSFEETGGDSSDETGSDKEVEETEENDETDEEDTGEGDWDIKPSEGEVKDLEEVRKGG